MAPKAKKKAPVVFKQRSWKPRKQHWEVFIVINRRSAEHPPSGGPRPHDLGESTKTLSRMPRRKKLEHYTIIKFPWPLGRPGRRQKTPHLCSLWMPRPTSTRTNRLWRNSMILVCQSQYSNKGWWRENNVCVLGSWVWCSAYFQQNWDHLNSAQL